MKQTAKAAELANDAGAMGGFHQGANTLDKGFSLVNINPRFFI
jgi:hypothetical protein